MTRDMDLIWDILIAFDADPKLNGQLFRRGRAILKKMGSLKMR
jgi:hypothetical protein